MKNEHDRGYGPSMLFKKRASPSGSMIAAPASDGKARGGRGREGSSWDRLRDRAVSDCNRVRVRDDDRKGMGKQGLLLSRSLLRKTGTSLGNPKTYHAEVKGGPGRERPFENKIYISDHGGLSRFHRHLDLVNTKEHGERNHPRWERKEGGRVWERSESVHQPAKSYSSIHELVSSREQGNTKGNLRVQQSTPNLISYLREKIQRKIR